MNKTEYLLTTLSEECSEISERACRIIRFGPKEIEAGELEDNTRRLERELADLLATSELLGLAIWEEDSIREENEHLLTILIEKCAKVAQRTSKAARFGLKEIQPGQREDNTRRLERELSAVMAIAGALGLEIRKEDMLAKQKKLEKFMAYSREVGALQGDK